MRVDIDTMIRIVQQHERLTVKIEIQHTTESYSAATVRKPSKIPKSAWSVQLLNCYGRKYRR